MSRRSLELAVREKCGLSVLDAHIVVLTVLEAIEDAVATSGRYDIHRFGRFTVGTIKARRGYDPRTGEPVDFKPTKFVAFRIAPHFRKKLIERGTNKPPT